MEGGLVSKIKSAIGIGAIAYLPITLANSIGSQTFVESLIDGKTLAATGLVALAKLGYDTVVRPAYETIVRPAYETISDTFYEVTGW